MNKREEILIKTKPEEGQSLEEALSKASIPKGKKIACVYHSRDLDGWMSGAIVRKYYEEKFPGIFVHEYGLQTTSAENELVLISWDYGDTIPNLDIFDIVVMCDVSWPDKEMIALYYKFGVNFIWIDHHKSAIEQLSVAHPYGFTGKQNTGLSACELTWQFFFSDHTPERTAPDIVTYLGLYDSFRHKNTEESTKVMEIQYGARESILGVEDAFTWLQSEKVMWNNREYPVVEALHMKGAILYSYEIRRAHSIYQKSFPYFFVEPNNGRTGIRRKFLVVNEERFNPVNFGIDYHKAGYEGFACFWYKNGKWTWSLYNDDGSVDCSSIAKYFGGGGHKGAAGFVQEELDLTFKPKEDG